MKTNNAIFNISLGAQAEGDYENWEGTLKTGGGGTLIEKF